ncbi:hypothetical protein [Paenibacillus planticolens]|uniref:hypothetical protein n=1 Tax=Paenibacillus planticolens TaxID=2654976 RepID=UPI001492F439|nr:hypothetical protein [Paenibacillus planticolens]
MGASLTQNPAGMERAERDRGAWRELTPTGVTLDKIQCNWLKSCQTAAFIG